MNTWLADFHERTELNKYPVALRTRGGVGYKVGRDTISNFVGHPVHYLDAGQWKPITLAFDNGNFEGSPFGWNGQSVTHKGKELFKPVSVTFDGRKIPLNFSRKENEFIAEVGGVGLYKVIITESGVREEMIIPTPLDGLLEFDVRHAKKPPELHKKNRYIKGMEIELTGNSFLLTKDMPANMVIDPDYAGDTADGRIAGTSTDYATARDTPTGHNTADLIYTGQLFASPNYSCYRGAWKFDSSGIPDTDDITQVNAKYVCTEDNSTVDFDVEIVGYDWTAGDPIGSANRNATFDGILAATLDAIWRNTSGMSVNTQYTSNNLDTAWVSKDGYTRYGTRSAEDYNNSAPTDAEWIKLASSDHATPSYRPVLTVVHAAAGGTNSGFFSMF